MESTPRRLVAGVVPGTLLNALNSSMIALALVPIERHYGTGLATATWLISGFYLAATVCLPLMGRLADRFGARRVFISGLLLVCVTSAAAPLAPNIWFLVAARVLLAVGTSVAFPAAMAVFRATLPGGPPQTAMAAVATANSSSAAFGPVLGGILVSTWGWQAIWLVNIPVTLLGIVLAFSLLPAVPARPPPTRSSLPAELDLPGIAAFVLALGSLVGFLLSLSHQPRWLFLPLALLSGTAFLRRERRAVTPFIDLAAIGGNRRLVGVFAQNTGVSVVFYMSFIGLPQWLQGARGEDAGLAGMIVLPLAGITVLVMPLVTRLLQTRGERVVLTTGSLLLLAGSTTLLLTDTSTPVWAVVTLAALLGLPNAFNNLGLQSLMYRAASDDHIGTASGLFQTFRFLGSITASATVGVAFGAGVTDDGLHTMAVTMVVLSASVAAANLLRRG